MVRVLKVFDEHTKLLCFRIRNDMICLCLSSCQLVIAVTSLAQHVYSLLKFNNVFLCRFNQTGLSEDEQSPFLAADVIIFDFGLFNRLLGVQECIANHLDGGYMRGLWCLGQSLTLVLMLIFPHLPRPHPWLLFPMLINENFYVLGLLILTLATMNKMVVTIIYGFSGQLFLKIAVFGCGTCMNFFLNYVLWHYYWYVEAQHKLGWTQPTAL